ncbi:hypothetical protein BBta_5962 [Bradyrhizobium sp. BTAi1]|nr:hypothetical protein BBta_5962 [Bradyrhizobium sp. BTAi1]
MTAMFDVYDHVSAHNPARYRLFGDVETTKRRVSFLSTYMLGTCDGRRLAFRQARP